MFNNFVGFPDTIGLYNDSISYSGYTATEMWRWFWMVNAEGFGRKRIPTVWR